jgi:hypothetical protein
MKPSSRVATKAAEAIVRPYQVCPMLAKNHIAKIPIADDARVRVRAVLICLPFVVVITYHIPTTFVKRHAVKLQ